jgi:hypothetical protein
MLLAPSTHVGLLWSAVRFSSNSLPTPEARATLFSHRVTYVTHLSCSGAEPRTPGQTLSTLSRLLRQPRSASGLFFMTPGTRTGLSENNILKNVLTKVCNLGDAMAK